MFNNFSPNMLKTYQTCPKKFYLRYIECLNVPVSASPFEKGKKIHALANYTLCGINITRIETALSTEEKLVWEKLLNNEYFRKDSVQSEYQISCKVNEFWVGGRLDAVVHDDRDYFILDYKTGSIPKNAVYDFQTMIYLLALDKILKTYNSLSFVYIDLKNNENHVIKLDESLKISYVDKITEICTKISSDNVYPKICANCAKCEFAKHCQYLN